MTIIEKYRNNILIILQKIWSYKYFLINFVIANNILFESEDKKSISSRVENIFYVLKLKSKANN